MNILITFMYIFAFKISIIDSTILLGIIFSVYMLFTNNYKKIFFTKISSKHVLDIVITFMILISWTLFMSIVGENHDLSYCKVLIHLIITIMIGYEVIAYYEMKELKENIVNYIIIAFIIQSLIQWLFFAFPQISQYFNVFRSKGMIERSIRYSGYRGIAITTSGFFSLSSAYAVVIVLYFTKYNTLFKNKVFLKYMFFMIMASGTFFAGRTGFIGIIFALLLAFAKKIKGKHKINFKRIAIILIIFIISISFINVTKNNKKFKNLYNFAFELIKNYENGKGLTTTSTSKLWNMYNMEFSTKTFLIGDGIYTEKDNQGNTSYYKQTDVGYYRKILYFGVIGLTLSIILQYYIFGNTKNKLETIILLLLLATLELKGEILGLNIMVNSIIVLYSNICKEREKKNGRHYSIDDNL